MKGTRALSFLLTLALLASLMLPGSFALPAKAEGTDNGMHIEKTAVSNNDGTYTITLEAYATGSQVITQVSTEIPTDIVLVLDQSGSMAYNMSNYDFRAYTNRTNSDYYNLRHNGARNPNLYYRLEDGGYASVSVVRTPISGYRAFASSENNDEYYDERNNLYVYDGTEYKKVNLSRKGKGDNAVYTYTFPDGSTFVSSGEDNSPGDFGGKGPLYKPSGTSDYSYTYSYTDENNILREVGPFNGANAIPQGLTLYQRYATGTTTRLAALKNAVSVFVSNVAAKASGADGTLGTEDDVNHRIAVVGFASESGYGNNTELLSIAGSNSGSVGIKYGDIRNQNYKDVLQNMDTAEGRQMVTNAINALAADGATETDLGMAMANGVFNANPISTGEQRNRVVIVFTDGSPTSWTQFDPTVANAAISGANTARGTYGATVYAVGIFEGADATSAGNSNGNETEKVNWFMQNLSNNQGTPQSPSYYLSASDSGTLNSIFQQISNQIQSGGSTATLDSGAVVKDIIAPSFQLPEGTEVRDITLKTYSYTGENAWDENEGTMGAQATINGSQVSVTGFNFSDNWCGTVTENEAITYRGNKLVISFKVEPKPGFLGGNGVYTNTNAGVYENADANEPIMYFERPQVDVPINAVNVTAQKKNVYLLQNVPYSALTGDAVVTVGGVSLNLSQPNYGLETWQNEYVDITVTVTDQAGTPITGDLTGLTTDITYNVAVKVSPKQTQGEATEQSGSNTGNINVFKPELTFQDSSVYYGETAPTDFTTNLASTAWKHGETVADETAMGQAPLLTVTGTPINGVTAGMINTKQDIPVGVTVKMGTTPINDYTTFLHTDCSTGEDLKGGKFLLHVNTCTLTITKTGGAAGEPYVFVVQKEGVVTEVTIVGNGSKTIYELPVGTYSITEDTAWSWRYTPSYSGSVTLTSESPSGVLTCNNTLAKQYWLNGFSTVVKNVFGVAH